MFIEMQNTHVRQSEKLAFDDMNITVDVIL